MRKRKVKDKNGPERFTLLTPSSQEALKKCWEFVKSRARLHDIPFEKLVRKIAQRGASRVLGHTLMRSDIIRRYELMRHEIDVLIEEYCYCMDMGILAGLRSLLMLPITSLEDFKVGCFYVAITIACKWSYLND